MSVLDFCVNPEPEPGRPRKVEAAPVVRDTRSSTRVSFVISATLHAAILLFLAFQTVRSVGESVKLTEVTYIEQRYGKEVAEKVTVAPEKIKAPAEKVLREGSLFAEAKPKPVPRPTPQIVAPVPMPEPARTEFENPFEPKKLEARSRRALAPAIPKVSSDAVALAGGIARAPAPNRRTAGVDLAGKVLVGRKAKGTGALPFEVAGDEKGLAGSDLTLALPSGGVERGHPELVGGALPAGKEGYTGDLPSGNLVAKNGRLESLAGVAVKGPGGDGPPRLAAAGLVEPTAGTGLVSRGGHDSVSRGGDLVGRRGNPAEQAQLAQREIAPAPAPSVAAPAKSKSLDEGNGVSVSLSGPILEREIIRSVAPAYPAKAKTKGWLGTVSVYFTVRPDGSINKVLIDKASAHRILDEAAKASIREWRFSAIPGSAEQWGILTIVYRLR